MDSALILRMYYDQNKQLTDTEINDLLSESKLVNKLTKDYQDDPFFHIFRIICLSEIPYIERLEYTQKVIAYISDKLSLDEGFSYTGKGDYIVPCYNAMLLEAYVRLGLANTKEAKNALNWIKKYQVFARNQKTTWNHNGICKHGGCMNATPCYIGIGKTVRALITYQKYINHQDIEVGKLIKQGEEYMLTHHMYQRLTNQKPISGHIMDIIFPQAYMLSLTDLVYIVNERGLWHDVRTLPLKEILNKKQVSDHQWKIDYIYQHKGYKAFETRRNPSQWINYLFNFNYND